VFDPEANVAVEPDCNNKVEPELNLSSLPDGKFAIELNVVVSVYIITQSAISINKKIIDYTGISVINFKSNSIRRSC
jgi:hypothetical protein